MTLRARLAAGLLAIALVLVIPLVLALRSLDQLHAAVVQLRNTEFAASLLVGRIRSATAVLEHDENAVLFIHDQASADALTHQIDVLRAQVDSLDVFGLDSLTPAVRAALSDVATAATLEFDAANAHLAARADSLSHEVVLPAIARIADGTSAVESTLRIHTEQRAEVAASRADRARKFSAMVLIFAALLAGGIAVWLTRSISGPVREVEQGMAAVAGGEFSHALKLRGHRNDEFGRLATSFATMSRQLAELDKLKAEFVSVASHELKTPLNVMLGYVQLLQEGVYGPLSERQLEICQVVEQQGHSIVRLVKQLLDVSRFEAGGGKLEPRRFALRPFLDEMEKSFQVLAMQRDIKFVIIHDENLPAEVFWDRDRVSEVLGNLLSNAFKFTPAGGRVELGAHAHDDMVRMYVRDTGAGIPPEQLPRIFDKFYQADNQRAANGNGTGLGLTIAKTIVEAQGGTIAVKSAVGSGTVFTLTLPIILPRHRWRNASSPISGESERVMV